MRFPVCAVFAGACLVAADSNVKVENDAVRILKVVDSPHHKGPLHRHEINRVMIYLDPGNITLVGTNGEKEEQHWTAGQAAWSPASGMHTSENVGTAPIRIVEIELKKPAPPSPTVRNAKLDPVAIDPKHNILLFENAQVRVFRSWREPGATEMMHEHAGTGRATVMLTEVNASVKLPDGTISPIHGAPGDVFWSGPVTHATTNLGPGKLEMVVVEVK